MFKNSRHPSDRVLACAVDDELSTRRRLRLDAHLRECDRCRTRFGALASVGNDLTQLCRDTQPSPCSGDELRDRLRTEMTARAAAWNESRTFRLRQAIGAWAVVLRVGAPATILILVLQALWLSSTPGSRTPAPQDVEAAALPDPALTPGAVGPVNINALCAGRTVEKPPVAPTVRDVVLRGYRMENVATREYELDYLITPELGGVPDARNLWPERYSTSVWNAGVKDDLEDLLPRLICQGQVDLATAQRDIATNWIAAYKKYFNSDRPLTTRTDQVALLSAQPVRAER